MGKVTRPRRQFLMAGMLLSMAALAGCQTAPPKGLSAAQIAVLKQQGFEQTDDGWTLGLSDKLLFGSDDATLSPESRQAVTKVGRALLSVGVTKIRLLGFTDASGSDAYNLKLSERRTAAVAEALVSIGVTPSNIAQRGLGKQHPVADDRTPEGRAQNRRVAMIVDVP